MSMYQKYLLKRNFWRSNNCFIRHDERLGGIYAYVQNNGVKIVANDETHFFNNFNELEYYLNQLSIGARSDSSQFLQLLNRHNTSKYLRQVPI
jgi:hypothetical protein